MRSLRRLFLVFMVLAVTVGACRADEQSPRMRLNVQEFTLPNGMLFLVVERPTTPQVACRVAIRAGSAHEEQGKTGIAHMLEHMMFKGTKNFGTTDFKKDQELQEQIEAAYQVISKEKENRIPDEVLIKTKRAEMNRLRLEVQNIFVPQAFSSQLGRNGAVDVNAFTGKDQTQYTAAVPSDMLEQWFSIISEQLFEPSWREFYVEKEVVQREWAFRYINNPEGAAWLDLDAIAYTAHPYRNPTIGWKTDMERFSASDAIAFHEKFYNPTNAVCVLVGDVTLQEAQRLANVYFARYPGGARSPEKVTEEPQQHGPRKSIRFLTGARTPVIRIGFHAARMSTPEFYALDALTMILSHGRGARMTQNIVNRGLAMEAWAYNPDNRYGGIIVFGGSPTEPKEPARLQTFSEEEKRHVFLKACEDLETLLLAEAAQLQEQAVSQRDLDRIKKLNQRDFMDRLKSNEALAGTLATLEVEIGWQYLLTYLDEIAKVTPEDIVRVARKYLRPENQTTIYVIPGGTPDRPPEDYSEVRSISGKAAANAIRPKTFANHSIYPTPEGWRNPLSFDRTPEKIRYPEAEIATVEGASLFYLPDRELPLIDLSIHVKAGEVDVAETHSGLSQVLEASIIRGGTEKYPPAELAVTMDENAIQLGVSINVEESVITLSCMKQEWERGLALLQEILTKPRFDLEVLRAVKNQLLTSLTRETDDARAVAHREGMIWHFRGHPYGRDPLRGLETIPTVTSDDLKGFLTAYFVPSNMVIAVSGDIERTQAEAGVKKLLKALPHGKAPERTINEPADNEPIIALIHKPGQVQPQMTLILPSLKRTHPDYWKASLLLDVFGGSDSLLYTRLRDDLGLVYAAWFYQTYKWQAGILVGYIGCKGDKTAQAIGETVRIMKSLHGNIPSQELEQKRLDVLNSFVFNVDTPAALVDVYSRYCLRGEPLDTLDKIQNSFMNAKSDELETLARRFLDPSKLQVFVVGDKTTLVRHDDGSTITLEDDLKSLAQDLNLSFTEIPLR